MNVIIKDLREIETKKRGTCVRFSVTFCDDDGEPACTMNGFMMDRGRRLMPPGIPFGRGVVRFTTISQRFEEQLRAALEGMKFVQDLLGKPPADFRRSDEEATL